MTLTIFSLNIASDLAKRLSLFSWFQSETVHGKKGILTVLGPAHYGYEMDTISLYVKVGTNGNVYQAMNYLVHNAQSTVHPPLIQVSPAKLGYHTAHR